jgi:hypothetical protein
MIAVIALLVVFSYYFTMQPNTNITLILAAAYCYCLARATTMSERNLQRTEQSQP